MSRIFFQPLIDQDFVPNPKTYIDNVITRERVFIEGKLKRVVCEYSGKPELIEKGKTVNHKGEVEHVDMMWSYKLLSKTIDGVAVL